MAGAPSTFEAWAFSTLREGLSAAAGELDALLLAQACKSLSRVEQAHEALARDGLVATDAGGRPVPHPAVKIATSSPALRSGN